LFINVGGTWESVKKVFMNVSGTWKQITEGFINVAGAWQRFLFSVLQVETQVTISQATDATTKLITLTGRNYYWSPGPPALTYKFQRSSDNASWTDMSSGNAVNPAVGSSNTYTDVINLNEYVKNSINYYRFQVNATYGLVTGSSTSLVTSFQAPTNITVTVGTITSNSEIPISWTTSTGANRYLVYYSTDDITYTLWAGTAATSATVNGLTPGTLYYIKVLPVTGTTDAVIGYSGNFSNRVDGTTLSNTLSDFTIISVTKGFPNQTNGTRTVSASWNSSTNAVRYEILLQKSDDGGATWSAASQYVTSTTSRAIAYSQSAFHTTGTTTTITGVLYSAYYRFSVRAVNSTGTTKNATNAPFEAEGTAPGAPTNITTTPSTNSVSVGYTATTSPGSNSLSGIRYSTDDVTYSPGIESSNPFTVSGLSPNTDYTIYVKSANADNLYSSAASKAFTTTAGVPGPPRNLARSTGNGTSKTFTWDAPNTGGAVTKYQYNLNNEGWTDVTPVNTNRSQSIGVPYTMATTFQVKAVNGSGDSTAVSTGSFTVPRIASGPTASSITNTSATVSWTSNNQESYSLSIPNAPSTPYGGSTQTSRSITSLTAGTNYTPTLTITSSTSDTATTAGAQFTTTSTTTYYCTTAYYSTQIPIYQEPASTTDLTQNLCGNVRTICSTSSYPTGIRPVACTCTATCGAWSAYTAYGAWSAWSTCVNNTQTRTRSRTRTRTCTNTNCSTYTETETDTQTESQSCGGTTTCPQTIYGNLPGDTCQITCINGTTRTYTYDAACNCMLTSTVFNDCGAVFE
jgi:hypothetical protein